jgi:hypothetical protein
MNFMLNVAMIRETFEQIRPKDLDPCGGCLIWTLSVWKVLSREHRVIFQAGTCLWPRVRPEDDDGLVATHFGYEWHPEDPETQRRIAGGTILPEMHVWAALPESNEILDFSTGGLVDQCRRLIHADWPGEKPPPYLWTYVNNMPPGVIYRPDVDATVYALRLAAQLIKDLNLV